MLLEPCFRALGSRVVNDPDGGEVNVLILPKLVSIRLRRGRHTIDRAAAPWRGYRCWLLLALDKEDRAYFRQQLAAKHGMKIWHVTDLLTGHVRDALIPLW